MSITFIGSGTGKTGIKGRLWQLVLDPQHNFDSASKEAWKHGKIIWASWIEDDDPASALQRRTWELRTRDAAGNLPPGNKVVPKDLGKPSEMREWQGGIRLFHKDYTREQSKQLFERVPTSPGVFCLYTED